jgi:formylglycine-generating enzyme required for sulfatase activity/tRNA A-37 threonylcarbamoyl transferase component Bud32
MPCPPAEELSRWAIGELDAPVSDDIERHVLTCARCVETLRVIPKQNDRLARAFEAPAAPLSAAQQASVAAVAKRAHTPAFADALAQNPPGAQAFGSVDLRAGETSRTQPATATSKGKEELGTDTVLGAHRILKKLGQGGMGVVYLAEHQKMKRLVALKVLPRAAMRNHTAVKRFHREVQALAALSHANIITAFDADEALELHFFTMEYVEGEDLAALVKRRGPLPVAQALNYLAQAARGLEYAHGKGLIHRDVKPSNLLVDTEGRVKLLDLGLARFTDQEEGVGQDLTGAGVFGTPDYMAPEQAERTNSADARSDIYSLGWTLFYLLVGRTMYSGEGVLERVLAHINQPIPSLREMNGEVTEPLERVFRKMVAKKPEQRYQTVGELLGALKPLLPRGVEEEPRVKPDAPREVVGEATVVAAALPGLGGSRRPWNRRMVLAAGGVAAVLLFGVWLVFRDMGGKEIARVAVTPGQELKFKASPETTMSVEQTPDGSAAAGKGEVREPPTVRIGVEPKVAEADTGKSTTAAAKPMPETTKTTPLPVAAAVPIAAKMVEAPPMTPKPEPVAKAEPLVWPFDKSAAKAGQAAWAKSLGKAVVEKNGIGMDLVVIPAGTYTMGSPAGEGWIQEDSTQVNVTLTRAFQMSRTEVTQGQWKAVMGTEPWKGEKYVKEGDDYAATYVSWEDAELFCDKLSAKEGQEYRLPTEAEWEWACRAGSRTAWSFGASESELGRYAWFAGNADKVKEDYPCRVGQKLRNGFGLSDMHGNVWEMCGDWYGEKLAGGSNPVGASAGEWRVHRGGSWKDVPTICRSAVRFGNVPSSRYHFLGFRLVLSPSGN